MRKVAGGPSATAVELKWVMKKCGFTIGNGKAEIYVSGMETNLSRLLNFLPALVLVGFMGCGGNTPSDHKSSKGDGTKTGGTQNKPKATKFTPEIVKAAMEAALKQLPNLGTKEWRARQRAQVMEPEALQRLTDELNKNISGGKIDHQGLKVDAITIEALTEAFVAELPKAKKKSDLVYSILNVSLIGRSISHGTDEWGDVALSQLKSLLVFYSPQHPDTKKLTATLPKPAKPDSVPKDKRVSHYALNKSMAGNGFSGSKVLVFECDLGWNGVGGLEDALKYMEKHKLEKIAVAKGNGSSIAVTQEELKKLEW